jgi:hypothetical protein
MGRLDRRDFLRTVATAGVAASLPATLAGCDSEAPPTSAAWAAADTRVQGFATLGRTGLRVSDIGFGSFDLEGDADLVRHALDRGINYFETAESYRGGQAEVTLGKGLAGVRDRVVLTSKVVAEANFDVQTLMSRLEESLRRLQTDYLDIYLNHAVNSLDRVSNPAWGEFVERARQQGKIRFAGISGHGHRIVECIDYAVEHRIADVMLIAYSFAQTPSFFQRAKSAVKNLAGRFDIVAEMLRLPEALGRAHDAGVGVICMKTLHGARLNDMRPFERAGGTFAQAAFRWVLSQGHVDSLIVTMTSREQVNEYLGASGGGKPQQDDLALLEHYEALNSQTQCRSGCSACASSCPDQVAIREVLRTRMYADDYGLPHRAREEYAALGAGAQACFTCTTQACLSACPYGLRIPELTRRAHLLGATRTS